MKPDHGIVLSFHLGFWWEDVQKSVRSASRICNGAIWDVVVRGKILLIGLVAQITKEIAVLYFVMGKMTLTVCLHVSET